MTSMNRIDITHNPLTIETEFRVNDNVPAPSCKLLNFKPVRFQFWVERLFPELAVLLNGDERYRVRFTGVQTDFEDLDAAADVARAAGATIALHWIEVESVVDRFERIHGLVDEAGAHPALRPFIDGDAEVQLKLEQAFKHSFDACVVATMSSGKSTLINAMLGRDLLPSANEATTATITHIIDNKSLDGRFFARRFDGMGVEIDRADSINLATMKLWNKMPESRRIDIEGAVLGIRRREGFGFVLTDTPGPNNSRDANHELTTLRYIQDVRRNPFILYVLNCTQPGVSDDARLLKQVAMQMANAGLQSKDRFIFLLNKMDALDPEKEDVPKAVEDACQYLVDLGIPRPRVFPISAQLARLLRVPDDEHSRQEKVFLAGNRQLFQAGSDMDMRQYTPLNERLQEVSRSRTEDELLLMSGLPAVEAAIDDYIDKYDIPSRCEKARDALDKMLRTADAKLRIEEQLRSNKQTLAEIDAEIGQLESRGRLDFSAFSDALKSSGLSLPEQTKEKLLSLEASIQPMLRELSGQFQGEAPPQSARAKLEEADRRLRQEYLVLVNEYESTFVQCNELISDALHLAYRDFLSRKFDVDGGLEVSLVHCAMKRLEVLTLDLSMRDSDVRARKVKTGDEEVSLGKWWNPFTWGDKKLIPIYESRQFANLHDIWSQRETEIDAHFTGLVRQAQDEIMAMCMELTGRFVVEMSDKFDRQYDEILATVSRSVAERNDRAAREQALREAEALHDWIDNFKARLDAIIEMTPYSTAPAP
jgi:GTPase Era involved in 16S rRNA processing